MYYRVIEFNILIINNLNNINPILFNRKLLYIKNSVYKNYTGHRHKLNFSVILNVVRNLFLPFEIYHCVRNEVTSQSNEQ